MTDPALRHRPVLGGPFGRSGRYLLASLPRIEKGLHAVKFIVTDLTTGAVLSIAEGKREALARAREALQAAELAEMERVRLAGFPTQQGWLWPPETMPSSRPERPKRPVSKRRRAIFEKAGGRCHYCATTLKLDGPWEADHAKPRALGGSDDILNRFAACVACNRSKGPRTSLEYVVQSDAQRGASEVSQTQSLHKTPCALAPYHR